MYVRIAGVVLLLHGGMSGAQETSLSHPPLVKVPAPLKRPAPTGRQFFVDPVRGDDAHSGKEDEPWETLRHALGQLKAGDTLNLRGGVYYEQVAVRLVAADKASITIRSAPGEQAILDAGMREFAEAPAEAWEPVAGGAAGEFRSAKRYPNLRTVMAWFGDSMIGLHTYYHAGDLRSSNELWDVQDPGNPKKSDVKPLYCGPGVWYDPASGYIHCRLAHTNLPEANYRGVTDPRKLPMVVAPFRAVPLHVDGAKHVRFQDLVIRGGGYDTMVLDQASDIEFDNVTLWCGSYGMRITGTQRLKITRSGFYGSVPPWCFRTDSSLRTYPQRDQRDITRLGTHALLVPEAGREFSVYAYPINDDWEIAYCDFAYAHDGLYLGSVNVRFHQNRIYDLQDDGLYLSPMYQRMGPRKADVHIYQNYIGKCLTALAFGGPEKTTQDTVWLYRNVIDLRHPVRTGRPSSKNPAGGTSTGKVMGDHGSPPWPAMKIYHNTCVALAASRTADLGLLGATSVDRPRVVFNNLLLQPSLAGLLLPAAEACQSDGNLYGCPGLDAGRAGKFLAKLRASPVVIQSKKIYPPGVEANSLATDPKMDLEKATDVRSFRLPKNSPAVDAGVALPAAWPDPLRERDSGRPDIGALPVGVRWLVGRRAEE